MPINLKWLFKLPTGRLSRRIGLWVFVSVILIETIIFIPSLYNRKKELLDQIRDISTAKINILMKLTGHAESNQAFLQHLEKLEMDPHIFGGTLYASDGEMIGQFGEYPELSMTQVSANGITNLVSSDGNHYDSAWSVKIIQQDGILILRQDSTSVNKDLFSYFLRIAGLVVIISFFVSAGALIALEPIVITPILRLRGDLVMAGEAVQKDSDPPNFNSSLIARKDELGEVILAFVNMYKQIIDAINNRKQAEQSLQESLRQVELYSKALNKELEQGRLMQANFLPDRLPRVKGWEFAAYFKPARQVSGDFYDIFELPNGHIGIVIADVCDKGVGAALFMALIRSLIRIFSGQTELKGLRLAGDKKLTDPVWSTVKADYPELDQHTALVAVRMTNNYIIQNHDKLGMFATLFFGVLDPNTGWFSYINGGHEPLFRIDASGRAKRLTQTGPAVGLMPDANFQIEEINLKPGTAILGCTDGVTEARSPQENLYGRNRLENQLNRQFASANDLVKNIKSELFDFIGDASQDDDITLLTVRRSPESV
jgi:serine phosphatase RsbU (regulator of sigma subunit)